MNFLDAALSLIDLDFQVFPCSPGRKLPAIPKAAGGNGVLDATRDRNIIEEWARRFPKANVGVACGRASGITVIDLDPKSGSNETVRDFKNRKQLFLPTITVRTPSGGWHLYYQHEPLLLNSKGKLGPGIDVRSDRGYVIAPPSVLEGGREYRWHVAPNGSPPARMPLWAVEKLKPKADAIFRTNATVQSSSGVLTGLVRLITSARKGERNSSLYWAAQRLVGSRMLTEAAKQTLVVAAASVGIDAKEARKTIGSAEGSGGMTPGRPRS